MASSSISIEPNLDQYKDPANWENQDKEPFNVEKIPFRPSANSKVLADAHYFPRDKTRPSIYSVDNVRPPVHANRPTQPSLTLKYIEEWHEVCKQSIELVRDNELILAQWKKPIESDRIDHLDDACDAIRSYYNDNAMDSAKLKKNMVLLESSMPELSDILERSFRRNPLNFLNPSNPSYPLTSPEILYALYQARLMSRTVIDKHILKNPQKSPSKGRSASSWRFENLVDLCCIPLFNVGMEGIIPGKKTVVAGKETNPTGFQAMSDEVGRLISNCYIVKRILNEVQTASKTELSKFNTTHISWFLLNPWCLFFTTLRDLLTRKPAEIKSASLNASLHVESLTIDEDKLEASSEQLLHRFMEIILILFSILCGEEDVYRSTPGRVKGIITVGNKTCKIEDDGYVYVCRGGTSGHTTTKAPNSNEYLATNIKVGYMLHDPSERNRYGEVPIIRYEAKRYRLSTNVNSQIFSELLSAAISNMNYLEISNPESSTLLPQELRDEMIKETNGTKKLSAPYHDAFVIHMHHYTLTIHTARFPTDYLKWVTDGKKGDSPTENYCILYKVSDPYDLSKPEARLDAARDILTLLWAIRKSKPTKDGSSLFVARAVMRQSIGVPRKPDQKISTQAQVNDMWKNPDKYINGGKGKDNNNSRDNQAGNSQSASQSFNKTDGKKAVSNSIQHPAAGQRPFLTKDTQATKQTENFLSQFSSQGQDAGQPYSPFKGMFGESTASTGGHEPKQAGEKTSIEVEAEGPPKTQGTITDSKNSYGQYATSEASNLRPFNRYDNLNQQTNETRNTRTNREHLSGVSDVSLEGKVTDTRKQVMFEKNPFEEGDHTYDQSKSRRNENVSNIHEKKIYEKQMIKKERDGDDRYNEHERRGDERRGDERRGDERRGDERRGDERRGNERRGDERRGDERRGDGRRGDGREDYDRSGNNRRGGDRGGGYDRGGDYYRKRDHRSGERRRSEERGGGNRNDGRTSFNTRDDRTKKDRGGERLKDYRKDDRERKGYQGNRSGRRSYSSSYER